MEPNFGTGKNDSQLTPRERKDVECAANYASDHVTGLQGLIKEFEEKGKLGLFWDGKVPEKNKSFFNRISFSSSNKVDVIEDTKKYLDFFGAMVTAMQKLNGDTEMSESEKSDPLSIVDHLKGLLIDMDKAARSGLSATDSSALYRKHSEFIEKFSQLDSMVNRVECIFSREKIRNLTKLLEECQATMQGFKVGLKEFQNIKGGMEKQIGELVTENERQRKHQQSLVALNAKLREDQKDLLGQYNSVCNRLVSIEGLLLKLTEKKD